MILSLLKIYRKIKRSYDMAGGKFTLTVLQLLLWFCFSSIKVWMVLHIHFTLFCFVSFLSLIKKSSQQSFRYYFYFYFQISNFYYGFEFNNNLNSIFFLSFSLSLTHTHTFSCLIVNVSTRWHIALDLPT